MIGRTDSLNVAAATAVLLYEAYRARWPVGPRAHVNGIADALDSARSHASTSRRPTTRTHRSRSTGRRLISSRAAFWRSALATARDDRADLVALDRDDIVGFISGGPRRESDIEAEVEIYVIHVLPSHRGRGVGTALWTAACARLRGPTLRSMMHLRPSRCSSRWSGAAARPSIRQNRSWRRAARSRGRTTTPARSTLRHARTPPANDSTRRPPHCQRNAARSRSSARPIHRGSPAPSRRRAGRGLVHDLAQRVVGRRERQCADDRQGHL
jgi:ribosomal protein S18 acetylase RimI-like enzyme